MKIFKQANKFLFIAMLLATAFSVFTPVSSNAATEQSIEAAEGVIFMIDNEFVLRSGIVVSNETLFIPATILFENLGSVNQFDRIFAILHGGLQEEPNVFVLAHQRIVFDPGSNVVYVNDEAIRLEYAPFIHNDALYVPLIEVARLTGQAVEHRIEGHLQLVAITPYNRFGEDVFLFLNALNANGIIRGTGEIHLPAGFYRDRLNTSGARRMLDTAWNIDSRERTLQIIYNLYAGLHNARYMAEHEAAGTTSPWGNTGILAWDLARAAQVASNGFIAGYLTFDEFIQYSLPAAIALQHHFDSWEQMSENFVYGAAFWLRGSANEAAGMELRQQAHDTFVAEHIAMLPPWDMDLEWALDMLDNILEVATFSPAEPSLPTTDTAPPSIPQATVRTLRFVIDSTTFTDNGTHRTLEAAPFITNGRTMVPLRIISEALGATDIAMTNDTVSLVLDGRTITMIINQPLPNNMGTPVIIAGRTFVPLAYIINEMGAVARWDGNARAAYIYIG